MENQINVGDQNTQQIGQNPVDQPLPIPEKPKVNYWMISTIVLLIVTVIGGTFYFLNAKKGIVPPTVQNQPLPQSTIEPSATNFPTGSIATKSNQIRIGGLQLTYPESWAPIFATPSNGKNLIYFAKTEQESQTLIGCAAQGSCNSYPLKLEDFANYAVWQNSTVEDFIKQVRADIQLSSLQKTTIGGREAWLGYTDAQKTKHQAVIVTSTSQSKSFVAITASTSNIGSGMLEEYVAKLSAIRVSEYKSVKPIELTTKKGFVVELTSSLNTQDSGLVSFVLESLLAPKNSTKNYSYLLYTESAKSTGSSVGGPSYPKDNYLNNKYYLLTDNDQLLDGTYGTSQVQIKLSPSATKNLGLYLADPKYCSQDSDCQYRSNFCNIGAFNPYHQFATPWGCGSGDFEGLGNSEELRTSLGCQTDVEVKYDSLKCISNSCQTVNAKAVCKQ
ncbi:hypothetical protein KJ953_00200 [Patescibacteria group bacterium]|nr:hypothetical protein [Patescibacteria group bacterium]MBU1457816.1 hypothetical protein [Patescibacteria group bacterium]